MRIMIIMYSMWFMFRVFISEIIEMYIELVIWLCGVTLKGSYN